MQVGKCRIQFVEGGISGGFHAVFVHEVFGEALAAFELCCLLVWAKDGEALGLEGIDDAFNQKRFRADEGEADVVLFGEGQEVADAGERDIAHPLHVGSTGVAGGDVNMLDAGVLRKFPGQRVFAPACADDQDIKHGGVPLWLGCVGGGKSAWLSHLARVCRIRERS